MEHEHMTAALLKLREDVDSARDLARQALANVDSHEEVCSLRYETISTKLDVIPALFTKMDGVSTRVNLATGVWIGVLGVSTIIGLFVAVTRIHGG